MEWRYLLRGTIRKKRNGRSRKNGQGSGGENRPRLATVAAVVAGLDPAEVERFEANVDRSGGPDACHPWLGLKTARGWGRFPVKRDGRWTEVRAHRYAYELAKGKIPKGIYPDHECHTRDLKCPGGDSDPHRACCNAAHLARTTNAQNLERARRRRERQRRLARRRAARER
jgi:hypothetical protein